MIRFVILTLCFVAFGEATKSKFRITSDDYAFPGEAPYQVSLQIYDQHFCGGALIGPRHVLTAAHCVRKFTTNTVPLTELRVAVGTTTVPGGQLYTAERAAYPKIFNPMTFTADIAVVTLSTPVMESANVRFAKLPDASLQLYPGQRFLTTGFGSAQLGGDTSSYLKKLEINAVGFAECAQEWSFTGLAMNRGIFCATAPTRHGVCDGDSGGPLVFGRDTIVGISVAVSPYGCGTGVPDLFTKVSTFLKFIKSEMARPLQNGIDFHSVSFY